MQKYTVRWIEHHALEVVADSPDEAEEETMAHGGTLDTYCYSEIKSVDED